MRTIKTIILFCIGLLVSQMGFGQGWSEVLGTDDLKYGIYGSNTKFTY